VDMKLEVVVVPGPACSIIVGTGITTRLPGR